MSKKNNVNEISSREAFTDNLSKLLRSNKRGEKYFDAHIPCAPQEAAFGRPILFRAK